MDKHSFFIEIDKLESTWDAVNNSYSVTSPQVDLSWITGNVYCIGSGGSFSLAKLWQYMHESHGLGLARAMTPYEYFYSNSKPNSVILISASGKHHDILTVFKDAIKQGYKVLIFTTTPKSALVRLSKEYPNQSIAIYPEVATPKDGFLAVNSIIAISCLMIKFEELFLGKIISNKSPISSAINHHNQADYLNLNIVNTTFQIIASEWGTPAGLDMESRLAESGIIPCFLTDPRNFAHGRFLWLEKNRKSTNVIIFHTPSSNSFIKRFHKALIPTSVPCYIVKSPFHNSLGAIYCLTRSILLFSKLAQQLDINPGKPIVPEWGRKIHRLYFKNPKEESPSDFKEEKGNSTYRIALLSSFTGIVLDMDGTLLNTKDRYNHIRKEIISELERLLQAGMFIGIATGRGSSAYNALKKQIDKSFHDKIILGLYNGTLIIRLSEKLKKSACTWHLKSSILPIISEIINDESKIFIKSTQISIHGITPKNKNKILSELSLKLDQHARYIKIKSSGHSLDILPFWASKTTVIQAVYELNRSNILCIGDQGQVGGNDEELLSWRPSICVGNIRPISNSCLWIGKNKELQESSGTLFVLKNVFRFDNEFKLNIHL